MSSLDKVRESFIDPGQRDDIDDIRAAGFKRYVSSWTRIDAAATGTFAHGLKDIPHVASVLEATDSQGTGQAEASSVTVTKSVTLVSVANAGAARFFRVRAF